MPATLNKRVLRASAVLFALGVVVIASLMMRGNPRTFTVTAAEISLPEPLSKFDNPPRLMLLRGALAGPARSAPCPLDIPVDGPTPAPKPRPCTLRSTAPDRMFELRTTSSPSPFEAIQLSSKPKAPGKTACGVTLRSAAEAQDMLAFEWFRTNENCTAEATVLVAQREPSIDVKGLGVDARVVEKIGRLDGPTAIELPLAPEEPLELGYRTQNGRRLLWESKLPLQKLAFVAAAPTVFHHRVGWSGIVEAACEAAPGTTVRFETDAGSPLELSRIDLTEAGLEISLSVTRGFRIDTGTCELSSRELEFKAFFVWLLGMLVSIGVVKVLWEGTWKRVA